MVSHAGLEAVMHLRFLKTSALLLAISSIPIAATLLPLNYSRRDTSKPGLDVDLFSINTIPDGSKELYVHGFLTYIFSFLVIFVFYRDSLKYIELHREFGLRQVERGSRASRSIMITRLPRNLRSDEALYRHFSTLGVGEVEDAVILRYPAKLVRKLARREKALRSLEDAHLQLARNVLNRVHKKTAKIASLPPAAPSLVMDSSTDSQTPGLHPNTNHNNTSLASALSRWAGKGQGKSGKWQRRLRSLTLPLTRPRQRSHSPSLLPPSSPSDHSEPLDIVETVQSRRSEANAAISTRSGFLDAMAEAEAEMQRHGSQGRRSRVGSVSSGNRRMWGEMDVLSKSPLGSAPSSARASAAIFPEVNMDAVVMMDEDPQYGDRAHALHEEDEDQDSQGEERLEEAGGSRKNFWEILASIPRSTLDPYHPQRADYRIGLKKGQRAKWRGRVQALSHGSSAHGWGDPAHAPGLRRRATQSGRMELGLGNLGDDEGDGGDQTGHVPGEGGDEEEEVHGRRKSRKQKSAIDHYLKKFNVIDHRVQQLRATERGKATGTGFVTFYNPASAQLCAQSVISAVPNRSLVQMAPEPRDVAWENHTVSIKNRQLRKWIISGLVW